MPEDNQSLKINRRTLGIYRACKEQRAPAVNIRSMVTLDSDDFSNYQTPVKAFLMDPSARRCPNLGRHCGPGYQVNYNTKNTQ